WHAVTHTCHLRPQAGHDRPALVRVNARNLPVTSPAVPLVAIRSRAAACSSDTVTEVPARARYLVPSSASNPSHPGGSWTTGISSPHLSLREMITPTGTVPVEAMAQMVVDASPAYWVILTIWVPSTGAPVVELTVFEVPR